MININKYSSVEIDSRKCQKNSIFFCIETSNINNVSYLNDAIEHGATLIITNKKIECSVKVIFKYNITSTLLKLLDYFYPYNLNLIGITGTDGKTSTSIMLQSLINQNSNCGYIGTNGVIFNNKKYKTSNTTPDIITIRKYLNLMYKENVSFVTMECSSEGILFGRLTGLIFDCLIFTNITHEHLNTHKTMNNYLTTKLSLIKQLSSCGKIFYNADDIYLKKINTENSISFGIKNGICKANNIETFINKTNFDVLYKTKKRLSIPFFGEYNIYNCLACVLTLDYFNLYELTNFRFMHKIEGRFEHIKTIDKEVIIDFAHTPNALENLLKNIKKITGKNIILVMGSAGNKDSSKRPLLGRVANLYADHIIITSEDPKNELLPSIFSDIVCTIKKEYYLVLFRKDAIRIGIELLNTDSILVIVGKGLENYEQIFNYKFYHNDYTYAKSLLNA